MTKKGPTRPQSQQTKQKGSSSKSGSVQLTLQGSIAPSIPLTVMSRTAKGGQLKKAKPPPKKPIAIESDNEDPTQFSTPPKKNPPTMIMNSIR